MRISYIACDRCSEPISEGYILTGTLIRIYEKGEKEDPALEVGEYCTACFVGVCMARKLGLDEDPATSKFGTREKPLL